MSSRLGWREVVDATDDGAFLEKLYVKRLIVNPPYSPCDHRGLSSTPYKDICVHVLIQR